MKKLLLFTLAAFSAALLAVPPTGPLPTLKRPPRKVVIEAGKNAASLTADNTVIVLDPQATPTARFAAAQLQEFLSQILGKKLPVSTHPGKGHNIYVGAGAFAKQNGVDVAKLPRDGFIIKTAGKDIIIAGRDDAKKDPRRALKGGVWDQHYERATLFAVYDFLERFANVRFYFPGELGTIIIKRKEISIPRCNIFERPDFIYRKYSLYWDGTYFEGKDKDKKIHPMKTLNYYRMRMETFYLPSNHGMTRFNLLDRFAKSNPEYFAMTETGARRTSKEGMFAGHICWSSPVTEVIYQDIKAYLTGRSPEERGMYFRKKPEWNFITFRKPFVDVMPQDGFYGCRCPKCQKRFNHKMSDYANDVVWGHVIEWANRLKKENIPGILTMMAYFPYRAVPKVPFPDNIVVMVADTGPWNDGGTPSARGASTSKDRHYGIAAWHKQTGRKVWTWNYTYKTHNNALPGIPAPSPLAVGRYYKAIAPDVFGAYLASNCDRFFYYALNYYVFSRIAWDNSVDYHKIMDEFYKLMFGSAAPEMKKLLEEFEYLWIRKVIGRVVDTPVGPVNSIPGENELWNNLFSPAKQKAFHKAFDAACAKVGKNSLEAKRIELFRREFMGPMEAESKRYLSRNKAVNLLKFAEGTPLYLRPYKPVDPKSKKVNTIVTAKRINGFLEVIFDCEEPEMKNVVAFKREQDYKGIWRDNEVEFFINPTGDGKNYYQWIINSKGSFADSHWVRLGQTRPSGNFNWHSGAEVKAVNTARGFRLELRIPLKSLPALNPKGVPVNFSRSRVLKSNAGIQTGYTWSPYVNGFHDLENYGRMIAPEKELVPDGNFTSTQEIKKNGKVTWKYGKNLHWTRFSTPGVSWCALDNKIFYSAPCSMKIVSGNKSGNFINMTLPKLKPATRYRLSAMVKLENVTALSKKGGFGFQLCTDTNNFYPKRNMLTGSCDWQGVSFEFVTSLQVEKAKKITLRTWLLLCSGTAWVDNISLEEIK